MTPSGVDMAGISVFVTATVVFHEIKRTPLATTTRDPKDRRSYIALIVRLFILNEGVGEVDLAASLEDVLKCTPQMLKCTPTRAQMYCTYTHALIQLHRRIRRDRKNIPFNFFFCRVWGCHLCLRFES